MVDGLLLRKMMDAHRLLVSSPMVRRVGGAFTVYSKSIEGELGPVRYNPTPTSRALSNEASEKGIWKSSETSQSQPHQYPPKRQRWGRSKEKGVATKEKETSGQKREVVDRDVDFWREGQEVMKAEQNSAHTELLKAEDTSRNHKVQAEDAWMHIAGCKSVAPIIFYGDGRQFEGLNGDMTDDASDPYETPGELIKETKGLKEGDSVNQKEIAAAKNYALRLLAIAPRTAAKLRLKLSERNSSPDVIESTLADLQRCGLQSDLEYAAVFARSRWRAASWGPQRLKQELQRRGVSQDDIQKALHQVFESSEEITAEDEEEERQWGMTKEASEHLLVQASRQWGRGGSISDDARKRRMIGWLQRRGFNWSTIAGVLKSLQNQG